MDVIETKNLNLDAVLPDDKHSIYNCFDTAITFEIWEKLDSILKKKPLAQRTYNFVKAMRAPALDMMLRGMRIDPVAKVEMREQLRKELIEYERKLNILAHAVWNKDLNFNSHKQVKDFFYKVMKIPIVYASKKGQKPKPSSDRKALEKIAEYFYAMPIAKLIMACRDIVGKLKIFNKCLSEDGRIRTEYKVTGTETGRWSSATNAFGEGDNLQNWTESVRSIVDSDPGMKMAYIDLQQAESRAVSVIAPDRNYFEACIKGDLHTQVAMMVWQNLRWTKDPKENRKVAEQKYYREFSYRDMAKRGGHGTNYHGSAWTMGKTLHVPIRVMEDFQHRYFTAFSGIEQWHGKVAEELQTKGFLSGPMITFRFFLGRRNDDATLREAIAHAPQSFVGNVLNLGLYRVWEANIPGVQLLAQVHDAIVVQYPEDQEDTILPKLLDLISVPVHINGFDIIIPCDAQVGWNWGKHSAKNPDGLIEWSPKSPDKRTRVRKPSESLLDRKIY